MQINYLNSQSYYSSSFAQKKNDNYGLDYSDAKEQVENGNIKNMEDVIDYAYDKAIHASSKEEADKYGAIGFQLFSATINQSLNEAMQKQGVNDIKDFNTSGWQESRNEIMSEEGQEFGSNLAIGLKILEESKKFDGDIDPSIGFTRLESIEVSQNLLKDLLNAI
ncbi:hypothetical protein [Campylobacter estrildidarum]|uniref:Uncharacterized protein n=1 Tax=Campylobacter estrildidarum TaxID=2510189 RepID=A0A4U7BKN1_9BACT|nr:hypothetical protein [Campylobacter estrildidarum]TKX30815.1 hypothetical protein CQA69_04970 [Campylobacter estrildidarum]